MTPLVGGDPAGSVQGTGDSLSDLEAATAYNRAALVWRPDRREMCFRSSGRMRRHDPGIQSFLLGARGALSCTVLTMPEALNRARGAARK